MFDERTLSPPLPTVREQYAPNATVLDVESDFDTLPSAVAEDLGLLADSIDPASYPDAWVPETAPTPLQEFAGDGRREGIEVGLDLQDRRVRGVRLANGR